MTLDVASDGPVQLPDLPLVSSQRTAFILPLASFPLVAA